MKAQTLLSSWENPQDVSRANLVFENRNKNYGGYFIRVFYPDRIFRAFVFAVFGFGLTAGGLVIAGKFLDTANIIIPPYQPPVWFDSFTPTPPSTPDPKPPSNLVKSKPTTEAGPPVAKDSIVETNDNKPQPFSPTLVGNETKGDTGDTGTEGKLNPGAPPVNPVKPTIVAEVMPAFPGGEEKLFDFIRRNINYPASARQNNTQGYVYVTFVIDTQGKISAVKLARDIGDGCGDEAVRVVKKMPDWSPGKNNGEPVAVQYTLPINFRLK